MLLEELKEKIGSSGLPHSQPELVMVLHFIDIFKSYLVIQIIVWKYIFLTQRICPQCKHRFESFNQMARPFYHYHFTNTIIKTLLPVQILLSIVVLPQPNSTSHALEVPRSLVGPVYPLHFLTLFSLSSYHNTNYYKIT